MEEKILSKKTVFQGKVLTVEEKEIDFGNGRIGVWEAAYSTPRAGVSILGVDKNENVYLIQQYKGGVERRMVHLPSGGLNEQDDMHQHAAREFQEETGYRAHKLTHLLSTRSNPGYTDALGHLFLAQELEYAPLPSEQKDEIEDTQLVVMPFEQALAKAISGELEDQRTVIALLLYERMKAHRGDNC